MKRIVGVGNALTDMVITLKNDDVLAEFGLAKAGMFLVDNAKQSEIFDHDEIKNLPQKKSLGGSAANTIRALAQLNVECGLIGKVGRDETGRFFEQALVDQNIKPLIFKGENESGHCLSLVSPDGERTMVTCLGAAVEYSTEDVSEALFDGFDLLYVEGYQVQNHEAVSRTVEVARECGLKTAIDLASFNVVEENREFLLALIRDGIDIVFANEDEARIISGGMDAEKAVEFIGEMCEIAVVKVGKNGALIKRGAECVRVGIMEECVRVDTTGAGDFFAGGFLAGMCRGWSLRQCGTLGAVTAGRVIEVVGTTLDEKVWDDIRERAEKIADGTYIL